MEQAGEEVRTTPITSRDTSVDITRKKTPALKSSSPRKESPTAISISSTRIRRSQPHAGDVERAGRGHDYTKEHHRHRHKHRHQERNGHEDERCHRSHKHRNEISTSTSTSSEAVPQATADPPDDGAGFIEDRKGDQYNVMYGSLHRYSIPRYRTAGYRRVVGLGRTHKILQSLEGNARTLTEARRDSDVRVKANSLLAGNVDGKNPPLPVVSEIITPEARDAELQRDFLALNAQGSRKRRHIEAQEPFYGGHDRSPPSGEKSMEQDVLPQRPDPSESESEESDSDTDPSPSQDNSFDQFRKDIRQQEKLELSRAVHDRPQDIDGWLALIKHHNVLPNGQSATRRAPTNVERYGLADVKISIYETALSKNATNPERERLVAGLMEEGSKIWDAKKLANQWKVVLRENAHFPSLWIKYLDFEQSNFLTFTYDQCKAVYAECQKITSTQPPEKNRDQFRIYLFLRLTTFMKDAGYSENAVGLWQAMLEFNYFHPNVVDGQTTKSLFTDFWDSEVSRVGEEGAKGWKSGSSPEMEPRSDTSSLQINPVYIFPSWADCEQERTLDASLPARTLDEVNDEDPYRVIITSDVSDYLFSVTDPDKKLLLLDAFLCFCRLPPLPAHGPGPKRQWWTDRFICSPELSQVHVAADSFLRRDTRTASPMANFVTDTSTLFANSEHWFSSWQDISHSPTNPRLSRFQQLALRQLTDALLDNEQLTEYAIAHQLNYDAKEARKLAKALLKQRPSNLRLYNAYALVESRLGNFEAAERVWSTALSMSTTLPDTDRRSAILLWHTWMWQLLDRTEPHKAFALLLAIPEDQVDVDKLSQQSLSVANDVRFTGILKARRTLELKLAQATSLHYVDLIYIYTDLLALLAYFTSTYSLTSALAIYSKSINPSNSSNPAIEAFCLELLHQSRARLLNLHTFTSPTGYQPAQITSSLAESVRLFPNNTIFLTLYHHHTQRSLLTDRIRTVLPTLDSSSNNPGAKDSPIPPIFAIWSEMTRPSYAGSTRHSIRAAFERTVEAVAPNFAIWKWYLQWELSMSISVSEFPDKDSTQQWMSRVRDIFYRGMRACPWAKKFYMLAFTESKLRDAIGFTGLRSIYETMVEKGIRIHVDLAELLEGRDAREIGREAKASG
jgi:tetratricopeptide (TPR) repeat protein